MKTLADLEAEIEADAQKAAQMFDQRKLNEKSKREPLPDFDPAELEAFGAIEGIEDEDE